MKMERQSVFRQMAFTPTTFSQLKRLQDWQFEQTGVRLNNNQLLAMLINDATRAAVNPINAQDQVEVNNHEQASCSTR